MTRPQDHTTERYLRDLRDAARVRSEDAVPTPREAVDPVERDRRPGAAKPPSEHDGP